MKTVRTIALACALTSLFSAGADAAVITGLITVRIAGNFRVAVTQGATVTCNVILTLAPDTSTDTTLTLANVSTYLLTRGGSQNVSLPATINAARTGYSCIVPVPYSFTNAIAGHKIIVAADVKGEDPGFFIPPSTFIPPPVRLGHTRQVLRIVGATSQTTTFPTATTSYNLNL